MSTSVIGTTLDAIVDGLRACSDLATVNVFSGDVSLEEAGLECIALVAATLDEVAAAMGGEREESWQVQGATQVIASWLGDTETTIRYARDRALELFAAVETYLNDTYTGLYPNVEVTAGELSQFYSPEGRICSLGFTLDLTGLKNP